jgi:DNA invertase Pin-like site-specific DNA recombinase
VSVVAQLKRDLIREPVSAGIRNARANGKNSVVGRIQWTEIEFWS